MNILIVPPVDPHYAELVISLAEHILSKFEDSSISIIVNLETYNSYYNCSFVDGLIVEPCSLIDKLRIIPQNHYDAILVSRNSFLWHFVAMLTKPKKIKNISRQLFKRNFVEISALLQPFLGL